MSIALEDYNPEPSPRVAKVTPIRGEAPARKLHPYYDYGPLLSHHAEYNFLVGGRGLGKTFGAKKLAIKRWIKNGDMFIYLRRHKEELGKARDTFFMDIAEEFPDWDFRANGNHFEACPASTRDDKKRHWELMGYAIALSTAQGQKSVSFPRVRIIIYDEFIIEKGNIVYLNDEPTKFNNFYSTVDRWQDKTTVFFLANAVSLANPYFIRYGILPDADTKWMKLDVGKAKGFILCHFPDATDFADSVAKTRFGQFINGSDYEKYAVGNEFHDNTLALLGVKNPRSRHMFNIETRAGMFSLWHDFHLDEYYAYDKIPAGQTTVTLLVEKMSEEKVLLTPSDLIVKRIVSAFRHKRLKFENALVRERWMDVMRDII